MINGNFFGVRSFSVVQSKGTTIEPENGTLPPEDESSDTAAAFPGILMQLLLGQQTPVTLPIKPEQLTVSTGLDIEGVIPVSETPVFTDVQPMPLQEQSLAGEMKKQSAMQKGSVISTISGVMNFSAEILGPSGPMDLPGEEVEVDADASSSQLRAENTEPSLISIEQKLDGSGIVQNVQQAAPMLYEEKTGSNNLGEKSNDQSLKMSIPLPSRQAEPESAAKDGVSLDRGEFKPVPPGGDLMRDDIVRSDHAIQQKFSVKNIETKVKETTLIPISSNDLLHKGILSANVTENVKKGKNTNGESSATQALNSEGKRSFEAPMEIETRVVGINTENQSAGNSSHAPQENSSRQPVFEKELTVAEVQQEHQIVPAVVEPKTAVVGSKVHQTEISTLLRQQDTVNNIVELLAKNVTISIHEHNSQMKVLLKPEALGDVMLKVSIDQGKVSTQMEVQQPQVKAVIESNLQMLRDSLTGKGLVVERIDISTAQYSLNEKSSQHGQHRSNAKNIFGKEIVEDDIEQTKLFGYNTVDYVA